MLHASILDWLLIGRSFQSELDMFRMLPTFQSNSVTLNSCADALRNMVPAMRLMFPTVEALVRLLLVNLHLLRLRKEVSAVYVV